MLPKTASDALNSSSLTVSGWVCVFIRVVSTHLCSRMRTINASLGSGYIVLLTQFAVSTLLERSFNGSSRGPFQGSPVTLTNRAWSCLCSLPGVGGGGGGG